MDNQITIDRLGGNKFRQYNQTTRIGLVKTGWALGYSYRSSLETNTPMIQPRAWFQRLSAVCTVHLRHDRTCTRSCSAKSIDRTGSGKGRSEWWRPAWRAGAAAFLQGGGAGMHVHATIERRPLFHTEKNSCSVFQLARCHLGSFTF
jgi:hypothetical protein